MISLMEVFGSLMILFVIVLFSHRHIKRSASRKKEESHEEGGARKDAK